MEPVHVEADPLHAQLVAEACKVLALPISASGFHWHPFGVFAIPLANRERDGTHYSRRLHVWHPDVEPVTPASPYGVHTHSGTGISHVLLGELTHHLYEFELGDGPWMQRGPRGDGTARLLTHAQGSTTAGFFHRFPAGHAHGVSKPAGLAISLFEQAGEPEKAGFTTWQRTDVPPEELVRKTPIPLSEAHRMAQLAIEQQLLHLQQA